MQNPNQVINSIYGPIIVNINDKVIGKHILNFGYYAKSDIDIIIQLMNFLLQKRSHPLKFYDVGANIGTHTLAISKTFGEQVCIISFEAQRLIFQMLCGTLAINGITNVKCFNNAISDIDGLNLSIALPDYHSENNFGGLELITALNSDNQNMQKLGAHEIVKTLTIDSINDSIDFLKIDIEGMEDKALMGARRTIERHRPICFIEVVKTDSDFVKKFFQSMNYVGCTNNSDLIAIPKEYGITVNNYSMVF